MALAVWLCLATIIVALRLSAGGALDTNLHSILPGHSLPPSVQTAIEQTGDVASNRVAFLVAAPSDDIAREASVDLVDRLSASGLFASDRDSGNAMGHWLFANRRDLLCERDPADFTDEVADGVRRQAMARIYGVGLSVPGDFLAADPFLLTLRLAGCLSPTPLSDTNGGSFVSGKLTEPAFQLDTQERITGIVESWLDHWTPMEVSVARSGAVFHAAYAARSAKMEMSMIGGVGLLGVALLFWIVFGRPANILYVAALIGLSTLSGLGATLLVFQQVHLLVLVFAAMLVGVVADYAVHAMAAGASNRWQKGSGSQAHLMRPMTVSMLTTAAGFSALIFFDVPLFQHLALFSVVGVVSAWLLVLFLYVPLEHAPRRPDMAHDRWMRITIAVDRLLPNRHFSTMLCLLLVGLTIVGAFNAHVLDDVRQFQARDADLAAEEKQIGRLTGDKGSEVFLMSQGEDLDAAKREEEAAIQALPKTVNALAFSRFDPSAERRAQNREMVRSRLEAPYLAQMRAQLGLQPVEDTSPDNVQRPDWLEGLHVTGGDGQHYLLARLSAAEGWNGPDVNSSRLIDMTVLYSQAFGAYRQLAALALLIAVAVSALIVLVVYRSAMALVIVAAPCAAMLGGIFIPAVFGIPISFFSIAGAMVLFGVSIDYSAFMWEAARQKEDWTKTSVLVGAITTLLSMGLLAMSETFPVRSFGVTVAIGVFCGLVYSMLPYRLVRQRGSG